jgi:hypothetical protein
MHRAAVAGVGESELARIVARPPRDDGSGVGEARLNQVVAVVADLAAALSSRDAELVTLIAEAETATGQLTDLEVDVAVLDSELEEADAAERGPLEARRKSLDALAVGLRVRAADVRRRLVAKVDGMRRFADDVSGPLFQEVDDVVSRLRSLPGGQG